MARSGAGDGGASAHPAGLEVTLLAPGSPGSCDDGADDDAGFDGGSAGAEDVITGGHRGLLGRGRRPVLAPCDRPPRPAGLTLFGRSLHRRWAAIESGRRRLLSIGAATVVLIGVGTAVVVTRPSGSAAADPRPSASYDPNADTSSALGAALNVPGGDVVDVAVGTADVYVASRADLSVVDIKSGKVVRQSDVTSTTDGRVVLDAAAGTVWDVDLGSVPGRVREYAVDTLKQTRSVVVPAIIYDAVDLDRRLYLATSGGVLVIAPGSTTLTAVTSTVPAAQALTVNATTHTVLALAGGTTGRIVTITDAGAAVRAGPNLSVSYPTIAAVKDALWVGGVDPDARLLRIDPATLRPLPESAGGEMVAEGTNNELQAVSGVADLWVYSRNEQRLYCADAETGEVLQIWNGISHSVSTGGRGPFVVTQGQAKPLVLRGRCTG